MIKKIIWFMLVMFPVMLIAEEIVVPDNVTDAVESTVGSFVSNTFLLSSSVMAIIQGLKKVLGALNVEISGIKSQALAVILNVVYVLLCMNVWEDGKISPEDIVIMIQGVVSAIGGIYGYKILWRNKPAESKEK